MRKIYLFLIGILVLGTVFATVLTTTFSSKEDMIDYFIIYKQDRELDIDKMMTTIKYTTDKECSIDYHSEKIYCRVCFEYTVPVDETPVSFNECLIVKEDSTVQEDDDIVEKYVRDELDSHIPIEKIIYKSRDMKDRSLSFIK